MQRNVVIILFTFTNKSVNCAADIIEIMLEHR